MLRKFFVSVIFSFTFSLSPSIPTLPLPTYTSPVTIEKEIVYVLRDDVADFLTEQCYTFQVPLWLAARLVERESNWNSFTITKNKNGTVDRGLAQLNSAYLDDFRWRFNHGKVINPYDDQTALYVMVRYLSHLYKCTGSWKAAVGAYNCGLTRLKSGNIPEATWQHIFFVFGEEI